MNLHKSDIDLAKALMNGNQKTFDAFFADYFPRLFRFVMNRVNDDYDLANDIAQESICKALDKIESYRGEASLFTWVCQISRSLISAHFVKQNRRDKVVIPLAERPEIREILDNIAMNDNQQPEQMVSKYELARLISEVLDNLPNNYGNILEWKYVDNLSVDEIAKKLDATMISVQSSLARARKMFQSIFEKIIKEKEIKTSLAFFLE